MRKFTALTSALILLLCAEPLPAWFNGGHMLVAYIAYKNLKPKTRRHVDSLIRLNPLYAKWVQGTPSRQKGVTAFVTAATWADCIKSSACDPGYTDLGGNAPPNQPTDAQNIGYSDRLMHKYWHFIDLPYSAGAPGQPSAQPNALTEIQLLEGAIGSPEAANIKSYDVVWLEHLVGDVHQPLHSTSRFTVNHPTGDAGGNLIYFCDCKDELHAYWDGLLGDKPAMTATMAAGDDLLRLGAPAGWDNPDAATWVNDSFELAKSAVYIAPISTDDDPNVTISPRPDDAYSSNAIKVAQMQARLAGYRLAALLNTHLH